jgi:hypothetical protein
LMSLIRSFGGEQRESLPLNAIVVIHIAVE